ncbi:metallophosphoesterase [Chelativorans sp. Marseille-P2723]|uniref:metallophosphoesterase family protein n=1 Tax=Chelativorans sp. Marseille-P2723 TaxID=2709133 RepID=UPI00156F5DD0|nr:metallophosphoesterase [Chelativorans sp. Marseille-P2723]
MSRDVTFVHLTDLHIGDPAQDDHLFSDTAQTLREILAQVASITPKPSFIVASGDLTNRGDAASYRLLCEIMNGTDLPVIYAIGNHDTREGFYAGMDIHSEAPDAPFYHDRVIDGIHVITLDSSTPNYIGGTIEDEQFDWLANVLDTKTELPKLIVSHHPPALGDGPDLAHWRHIDHGHSMRLAQLLKGRNIVGILSGHIHHDRVSNWYGIPVVVGTGQHAATDILRNDVLRMVRGSSFAIGTIRKSGLTVAFVPQPANREELNVYPLEMLLQRAAAAPVAAE